MTPPLPPGPIVPPPLGCLAARVLADGRLLCLVPLFGGRVRITLGPDLIFYPTAW
jgi:hypothetical protein